MQTFTVNEFIKLQLENGVTNILLNGRVFTKCKYLLISIPINETGEWENFESMDEIIKATTGGIGDKPAKGLTPEEAFQGHCSNLQAWVENGYDYRLLDTRLSIPIILKIMQGLLQKYDSKDPVLVNQKEYYKNKFKRFFYEVVKSLDDYIKNSRQTVKVYNGRIVPNQALYGKFDFMFKILFRTNDILFEAEEIEGSEALSKLYKYFLPKKEYKAMIRKRSYWERKLWKRTPVIEKDFYYFVGDKPFYSEYQANLYSKRENLSYRKFLRSIRDSDDQDRELLSISEPIDYLPYLYSMGKFTEEKNISWYNTGKDIFIRDSNGYYWKEVGNERQGF